MLGSTFPLLLSGSARPAMARPEERHVDHSVDASQPVDPVSDGSNVANLSLTPGKGAAAVGAAEGDPVEETRKFIETYSPNRAKHMKYRGGGKFKPGAAMVSRFLEMRALKNEDQALYEIRVKEMWQEDVIFSLLNKNLRDPANKTQLDTEVGKLIDLRLEENKQRIAKLQALLEEEQEKQKQLANREEAIAKREKLELRQNGPLFAPGAGNLRREQSEIPPTDPAQ